MNHIQITRHSTEIRIAWFWKTQVKEKVQKRLDKFRVVLRMGKDLDVFWGRENINK